jgi:hypothetical protein
MKLIRVAIALPPLIGLCILAGAVTAAFASQADDERQAPRTVSEAAAAGSAWRVLRLVRDGSGVNSRYEVRPGFLDQDGRELYPLEAALLGRHEELFDLLRSSGASQPSAASIECLAQYRFPELLQTLRPELERSAAATSVGDALARCELAPSN